MLRILIVMYCAVIIASCGSEAIGPDPTRDQSPARNDITQNNNSNIDSEPSTAPEPNSDENNDVTPLLPPEDISRPPTITPPLTSSCTDTDVESVLQNNLCLNCHNPSQHLLLGGGLNLGTGTLATDLLNRHSQHNHFNCQKYKIIDTDAPENSLLLNLIDPNRFSSLAEAGCQRQAMPQIGSSLSVADVECIESWVFQAVEDANNTLTEDSNSNSENNSNTDNNPNTEAFHPSNIHQIFRKAKMILLGEAPTESELKLFDDSDFITQKPIFQEQIQIWENSPHYAKKIKNLLSLGLLQPEFFSSNYQNQLNSVNNKGNIDVQLLNTNFNEMFIRTAWDIVDANGDFREVVTTRTWYVTTAILAALSYTERPNQSLDRTELQNSRIDDRFQYLAHLKESDYHDWRKIIFHQSKTPFNYENSAAFVQTLRQISDGGELPLQFPRVGFFSSPAFLEQWATNEDNDFRVTTQQALIGALGLGIEASDATAHASEHGIDITHATPTSACYLCHRLLDPMRLIFKKYQVSRHRAKAVDVTLSPSFAFQGQNYVLNNMDNFAQALANHPLFATAWIQKLCMWANGEACPASDPQIIMLAESFTQNNFDLKTLIQEFIISPLFSGSQDQDTENRQHMKVHASRGNHFCHGIHQGLAKIRSLNNTQGDIPTVCKNDFFGLMPPDGVERGASKFVQPTTLPSFTSKSIDKVCAQLASKVVKNSDAAIINSTADIKTSITQLIHWIMGIAPSHPEHTTQLTALENLYETARHSSICPDPPPTTTETATVTCGYNLGKTQALRAVWFSVCTSPHTLSIGL